MESMRSSSTSIRTEWTFPGGQVAFEGGQRALRAGFLDPASTIFRALASQESREDVWLHLAETELACGRPEQAAVVLAEIPWSVERAVLQAECALAAGDAVRLLLWNAELSPVHSTHPRVRFLEARILLLGGDPVLAEPMFLALASDPTCGPRAVAYAVFCAWKRGDADELVGQLFQRLRDDDAACEGLRHWVAAANGLEHTISERVEPSACLAWSRIWAGLWRDVPAPQLSQTALRP